MVLIAGIMKPPELYVTIEQPTNFRVESVDATGTTWASSAHFPLRLELSQLLAKVLRKVSSMKIHPPSYLPLGLLLCLLAVSSVPAWAAGDDWKPVDPAHLSLKNSTVEKEADAEAIFWEVKIDDNPDGDLIFNHYIRVKVFTERGRESQSKIDIIYGKIFGAEIKINDIAARTIKADGTIVELNKKDIFDRTVAKASGLKYKARSFAMPAVEPGCIIEYRWREVRVNEDANYIRLQFQRDIPVQRVQYLIKPYQYEGANFHSITLHGEIEWLGKREERLLQHHHDQHACDSRRVAHASRGRGKDVDAGLLPNGN